MEATAMAATWAGVLAILGSVSPFLGGTLSERMGRTGAAAMVFAISGLCSFTIGWLAGIPWGWVVLVGLVYSLFVGFDAAIYSTAVTEAAEPRRLGSTLAVHTCSAFSGGTLGPIVFGRILDGAGPSLGWGLGFATGGIGAVIAITALLWLRARPESLVLARGRR
jgi:MFS family permease